MVIEKIYDLVIGLTNTSNFLIIVILISLALIALILMLVERKIRRKIKLQVNNRNLFYRTKLKNKAKLTTKPEETLDSINKIARDFFKEAFNLPYNLEYSELIEHFRKKGKKECASFCYLMLMLSYSGEKIKSDKLNDLKKLLDGIIKENKITAGEKNEKTKEQIEKRENKLSFNKIQIAQRLIRMLSKIKKSLLESLRRNSAELKVKKTRKLEIKREKERKKKGKNFSRKNRIRKIIGFVDKRDPILKLEKKIELRIQKMLNWRRRI